MAKLTGSAVPTRETKGALGDIYTDLRTGIRYKCTFAYSSRDDEYYEWKNIGRGEKSSVEDKVVKENEIVNHPSDTDAPQRKTNYTQYSAASNKNK